MDERIPADDPGRTHEVGAGTEGSVPAPDENVVHPGLDAAQHAQELLAEDEWWSADGGAPSGA